MLRTLAHDRYWAQHQDREPTGFVSGHYMEGRDATLDDVPALEVRDFTFTSVSDAV